MSRYIITVKDPTNGSFTVDQAESQEEAQAEKLRILKEHPELEVEIEKAQTGLAIVEGLMKEIMR